MKVRIHGVAVLLAAALAPAALFAQAPAGVARVDSETYFDTSYSNTDFGDSHEGNAGYVAESESTWDQSAAGTAATRAGLLGTKSLRAAYLYNGGAEFAGIDFGALHGFDIEFNTPIPWLTSDALGVDFVTEYEFREASARVGATKLTTEGELLGVGVRLFAMPNSRVRPYVTLGAVFAEYTSGASGFGSASNSEEDFIINLGVELDVADNTAVRADFEIDREDVDESTFEGVVIFWLGEHAFFRGGTVIPLIDNVDAGLTIGGGVAF